MLRSETFDPAGSIDSSSFKIAPDASVMTLIHHDLPGITATLLSPTPRGVPHRQDTFYYRLNQQDSLWKDAGQQQNLAFYWDDAPDDMQVQVIFMGTES